MKAGGRTLNAVSLNPVKMGTEEQRHAIATTIRNNGIRIAEIQGTRVPHDRNYLYNGYIIFTCAPYQEKTKLGGKRRGVNTGGVSILINRDLEQRLSTIQGEGARHMGITLQGDGDSSHITILLTYAPYRGLGGTKYKNDRNAHATYWIRYI